MDDPGDISGHPTRVVITARAHIQNTRSQPERRFTFTSDEQAGSRSGSSFQYNTVMPQPDYQDKDMVSMSAHHHPVILPQIPDNNELVHDPDQYRVTWQNGGELYLESQVDGEIAQINKETTDTFLEDKNVIPATDSMASIGYCIRTNTPVAPNRLTPHDGGVHHTENTQHVPDQEANIADSQYVMYERTGPMSVTTERAPSVPLRQKSTVDIIHGQYGPKAPKYFYVEQKKPSPMPPLKAWRGYNGNVYFEPIKVHAANLPGAGTTSPTLPFSAKRFQASRSTSSLPIESSPDKVAHSVDTMRSSARSLGSALRGQRQMVMLDKDMVFQDNNDNLQEDVIWLVGQESTGSLCLEAGLSNAAKPTNRVGTQNQHRQQRQQRQAASVKATTADREKICRGSVAHKLYAMKNKNMPLMSVTGGRYSQQHFFSSPLLRTQTTYSHSNQRLLNSPDVFAGMDKLPPLEQLRASLKRIEPDTQGNMSRVITPLDRIKFEDTDTITKQQPFVKYSPEVKNRSRHVPLKSQKVP